MVVLNEISTMFWGVTLDGGKRYTQTVETSFHISMAALEASHDKEVQKNSPNVAVMLQHDKAEFLLCTLTHGRLYQQPLDLNFTEGEEVTFFLNGKGIVHLTGYLVPEDDQFGDESGLSDLEGAESSEVSDESDDSEAEPPQLMALEGADSSDDSEDEDFTPVTGKRKKKTDSGSNKKVKVTQENDDDSEEDDSDDDDDLSMSDMDSDDMDSDMLDWDSEDDDEEEESDEEDMDTSRDLGSSFEEVKPSKKNKDKTPVKSEKTPGKKDKTPKQEKNTPKQEKNTPKQEKKSPKGKDGKTPKQDGKTPKQDGKTPKQDGKSPKQEGKQKTPKSEKKPEANGTATPAQNGSTETPKSKKKKNKKNKGEATPGGDTPGKKKEMGQGDGLPAVKAKKMVMEGGLIVEEVKEGHGPEAKPGKSVGVYYAGKLQSGKQFDATLSGKPFRFTLGKQEVIKGWDVGLKGMKVGGKRKITVPSKLGYGQQRMGPIPPNSTLVFDVELKHVN